MKLDELIRFFVVFAVASTILAPQQGLAQMQKISCVGNSITYGLGLSNPSAQSYPYQLQVLLGTSSWTVGNFGDSGRTMLKNSGYSYWDSSLYTNALVSNPNYIMIELGTNDAKPWSWYNTVNDFVPNYKEMINVFRNLASKPDVWIGLIPPGQNISWSTLFTLVKDSVNKRIKQVALESGAGLIDLFDALGGNNAQWFSSNYFQADSIHPTTAGAAIIAQKVKEMLLMAKPVVTFANGKVTSPDGFDYQWYFNGVPIGVGNGGKLKEMNVTASGKYKVSIKLSAANETRIVSNELDVVLTITNPQTPVTIENGDFSLPSGATSGINNVLGWKSDDANSGTNTGNNWGQGYMTNLGTTGIYNVLAEVIPATSTTYTLTFSATNTYPSASGIVTNWIITFSHIAIGAAGTTRVPIKVVTIVDGVDAKSAQVTIPAGAAYAVENLVIGFDCKTPSDNTNASWVNMDNFALTRTDVSTKVQNIESISLKTYPNPFTTTLNIKIDNPDDIDRITVSDMIGRQVETIGHSAVNSSLALGSLLKPNMYIVQITGKDWVKTFKVIKK